MDTPRKEQAPMKGRSDGVSKKEPSNTEEGAMQLVRMVLWTLEEGTTERSVKAGAIGGCAEGGPTGR